MKQFQMILVLVALSAMGCAVSLSDVRRQGQGYDEHVIDQHFPNGSNVHIERTTSKWPGGLGGTVGGAYAQPIITNEYVVAPNGGIAMEQLPGGTTHVVGVPMQPTLPAQASEAANAENIVLLAQGHLQQQQEIDELKTSLKVNAAPKKAPTNK